MCHEDIWAKPLCKCAVCFQLRAASMMDARMWYYNRKDMFEREACRVSQEHEQRVRAYHQHLASSDHVFGLGICCPVCEPL